MLYHKFWYASVSLSLAEIALLITIVNSVHLGDIAQIIVVLRSVCIH